MPPERIDGHEDTRPPDTLWRRNERGWRPARRRPDLHMDILLLYAETLIWF